jgi:SAM-dependent methyltransferase
MANEVLPPEIPHSRENTIHFFTEFIRRNHATLQGKVVVDLSAGSGFIAKLFLEAGATVWLYDLFPSENIFCPISCQKIDLQQPFPIQTHSVDWVICTETLEHLPNQFFFFQEVGRICKPGGNFILTTPNTSSLRSRFSQFLMESEHYTAPLPNELNAYTPWGGDDKGYFSKLFMSGILRIRTLAALQNLRIQQIYRTRYSSTSVLLLIFYPWIYYFNLKNRKRQIKNDPEHQSVYHEIFSISTSLKVLLSKHMIIHFTSQPGNGNNHSLTI